MSIISEMCFPQPRNTTTGIVYDQNTLVCLNFQEIMDAMPDYKDRAFHASILNHVKKTMVQNPMLLTNESSTYAHHLSSVAFGCAFVPKVYDERTLTIRHAVHMEMLQKQFPAICGITVSYRPDGGAQIHEPAWCERHKEMFRDPSRKAAQDHETVNQAWAGLFEEFDTYLDVAGKNPGDIQMVLEYIKYPELKKSETVTQQRHSWHYIMANMITVDFWVETYVTDLLA